MNECRGRLIKETMAVPRERAAIYRAIRAQDKQESGWKAFNRSSNWIRQDGNGRIKETDDAQTRPENWEKLISKPPGGLIKAGVNKAHV